MIFEFIDVSESYAIVVQDPDRILYNSIHRMGRIYDTIEYIREEQSKSTTSPPFKSYTSLGFLYGHLLKLFLFNPNDYEPYQGDIPQDQTTYNV